MKTLTIGLLVVLGVCELVNLQDTHPKLGWTLTYIVVATWMWEAAKLAWKSRR